MIQRLTWPFSWWFVSPILIYTLSSSISVSWVTGRSILQYTGIPPPPVVLSNGCVDQVSYCPEWASAGLCGEEFVYDMQSVRDQICALSCNATVCYGAAPPAPPPPPKGPSQPLPTALVPEVVYFDASFGVSTVPGSSAVAMWEAAENADGSSLSLSFYPTTPGACSLVQDTASGQVLAVRFDGASCFARSSYLLPLTWNTSADSAFSMVWIGRYNSTSSSQLLLTLSRTPGDYDRQLNINRDSAWTYSLATGFALYASSSTYGLAPVGVWTMEVLVRQAGATSAWYHRYNGSSGTLRSMSFTSQPCKVDADNLVLGKDYRDDNNRFQGDMSVVLLYNRALNQSQVVQLAAHYAGRFGWTPPPINQSLGCPTDQVYDNSTGLCSPCERGSVLNIFNTRCTPCRLGWWPDATSRTCILVAADGNSELVAFNVSANPGNYFEFMTDDRGSRATDYLRAFRPKQGYWFGQIGIQATSYQDIPLPNGTPALIITSVKSLVGLSNPPMKPPTGWWRKWGFSGGYSIWCPTPPDGYVALGCVFRRNETTGPQPSEVERLMTLRADLVVAAGGVTKIWFDLGTGAILDGTLWRPIDSASGFSSGAMVASSKYDAASALAELATARMNWVLSAAKVFRTTAPLEGCPAGSAFDNVTRSCVTCAAGQVSLGFFGPCATCASGTQPNVRRSACETTARARRLRFDDV